MRKQHGTLRHFNRVRQRSRWFTERRTSRALSDRTLRFELLEDRRLLAAFQGLGDLPGGNFISTPISVSADGSTVVGVSASTSANNEAFRWTAADGIQGLGDLSGGSFVSVAHGVSADGAVVVGTSHSANGGQAFRWDADDGMQGLGDLPGGSFNSTAYGVSADGSVVVGVGDSANFGQAFRWTATGGMQGLENDLTLTSVAYGVSADGTTVVGFTRGGSNVDEAVRWTADGLMQALGDLPGGRFESRARAVSSDGSTVVGYGYSVNNLEAFRWTASDGMQGLGDLPGGFFGSSAASVSADGSTVVGFSYTSFSPPDQTAFRWTKEHGMESVHQLLIDAGVDLNGWHLTNATDVSADGRVIVGYGTNPSGQTEAWRAVLDQVVGLAWGEDVPRAYKTTFDATGYVDTILSAGSTPAAVVSPTARTYIRQNLGRMFADAGVNHISFVDGKVEGGTNIYFADVLPGSTLYGQAFTNAGSGKFDQYNRRNEDGAVVFISGEGVDFDTVTAGHEVGHLLGLRHVNPPPEIDPHNLEVMDYEHHPIGVETFTNGISEIFDKPHHTGPNISHNPVYHLRRYVDHLSAGELTSQGILPGQWDLLPQEGGLSDLSSAKIAARLEFGESTIPLYDVHIFAGRSTREDAVTELNSFASMTLQELEGFSLTLEQGTALQIVAASSPGGNLDVILATGDPFDPLTHGIAAAPGNRPVLLQLITNATSYTTLVQGSLIGLAGDYDGNETVEPADYEAWRNSFGATGDDLPADGNGNEIIDAADYVIWRQNIGSSLSSGVGSGNAANENAIDSTGLIKPIVFDTQQSLGPDAVSGLRRLANPISSTTAAQRNDTSLIAWLAGVGIEHFLTAENNFRGQLGGSRADGIAPQDVNIWDAIFESFEPKLMWVV